MEPRRRSAKIEVIRPDEIISIESKITIREVAKHQLKQIETSKAWQDHQKNHKDARLFVLGAAESSKEVGAMEKTIFEFAKDADKRRDKTAGAAKHNAEFGEEMSKAPGQEVGVKLTGAYKSEASGNQQFSYHGGHGSGTVMASCTCGQTFKTDEDGHTQTYKIKTDTTSAVGSEFGSYKKAAEPQGFGYAKKPHEEAHERKYGK